MAVMAIAPTAPAIAVFTHRFFSLFSSPSSWAQKIASVDTRRHGPHLGDNWTLGQHSQKSCGAPGDPLRSAIMALPAQCRRL